MFKSNKDLINPSASCQKTKRRSINSNETSSASDEDNHSLNSGDVGLNYEKDVVVNKRNETKEEQLASGDKLLNESFLPPLSSKEINVQQWLDTSSVDSENSNEKVSSFYDVSASNGTAAPDNVASFSEA